MKSLLAFVPALALGFVAHANTFTVNNLNAIIPDGDLNGYQNSQALSGLSGSIADVNVTLSVSGGFNGDLYAYLYHNGTAAILLNRVGRRSSSNAGYPDAGFGPDALANSFTLDDQASHDVHLYRTFSYALNGSGQLTGQWQPDGRSLDPLSTGAAFEGASRPSLLSNFNGMDPNGNWTLFIADTSPGGESTLLGWGVQLTTVPEPGATTIILFGFFGMVFRTWQQRRAE